MNTEVLKVKFWYWLVDKLPNTLIYYCFMHVMVHATTGKYAKTICAELTGMEAIKRFDNDHKQGE